jgi:hypothetical protein
VHQLQERSSEGSTMTTQQDALKKAYDTLHFFVDASDQELAERGITRDDALRYARDAEAALEALAAQPEQPVALNLKTWPERIWLQHGDSPDVPNYADCTDVSWCWQNIEGADVEYVRADLAASPQVRAEQAAVPDGWKLVPIDLEATMRKAFNDVYNALDYDEVTQLYDALIEAAPQPPQENKQ